MGAGIWNFGSGLFKIDERPDEGTEDNVVQTCWSDDGLFPTGLHLFVSPSTSQL